MMRWLLAAALLVSACGKRAGARECEKEYPDGVDAGSYTLEGLSDGTAEITDTDELVITYVQDDGTTATVRYQIQR